MELDKLLYSSNYKQPYIKKKKRKTKFIIDIKGFATIDATVLEMIKNQLNYINIFGKNYNDTNIILVINIESVFFKDRTVVMILELLLFGLLEKFDLELYLNIRLIHKNSIVENFFDFSYLNTINRKFVNSYTYCKDYMNYQGMGYAIDNEDIYAVHFRKTFFVEEFKNVEEYLLYQQILSTDVCNTLKSMLKNEKIVNETCTIIDELVDNILYHTTGFGLIDMAVIKVISAKDDEEYYQFMINVLNISDNCLYTDIKNTFKNNEIVFKNRNIIEQSYNCQLELFNKDSYSENLFFMVSAFQKGTTTRTNNRIGGTGLNKSIQNFAKRSQSDIPKEQSYVYSGYDILLFDNDVLNHSEIGNYIAFNCENDYNKSPDKKCITKSVYYLNGTAYNLMFIAKETDNNEK